MTSWKSEFYCSNSDVIFLVTSSSLHKNQLVDKNLPFLINDNACIPISFFQFFEDQLSQKTKTLILSWSISFEANDLKPSLSGSFWSILLPTSFPRHTFLNWGALLVILPWKYHESNSALFCFPIFGGPIVLKSKNP